MKRPTTEKTIAVGIDPYSEMARLIKDTMSREDAESVNTHGLPVRGGLIPPAFLNHNAAYIVHPEAWAAWKAMKREVERAREKRRARARGRSRGGVAHGRHARRR